MRHYALLLTLAFLKMALNKKVHFRDCCGLLACQLNGKKYSFGIFLEKSKINEYLYNNTYSSKVGLNHFSYIFRISSSVLICGIFFVHVLFGHLHME